MRISKYLTTIDIGLDSPYLIKRERNRIMKYRNTKLRQDKIDRKFKDFTDRMNSVINGTIQYKHGKFRITVRQMKNGGFMFILADNDWWTEFGNKFRKVARDFNYVLEHDDWSGTVILHKKESKNGNNRTTSKSTIRTPALQN